MNKTNIPPTPTSGDIPPNPESLRQDELEVLYEAIRGFTHTPSYAELPDIRIAQEQIGSATYIRQSLEKLELSRAEIDLQDLTSVGATLRQRKIRRVPTFDAGMNILEGVLVEHLGRRTTTYPDLRAEIFMSTMQKLDRNPLDPRNARDSLLEGYPTEELDTAVLGVLTSIVLGEVNPPNYIFSSNEAKHAFDFRRNDGLGIIRADYACGLLLNELMGRLSIEYN